MRWILWLAAMCTLPAQTLPWMDISGTWKIHEGDDIAFAQPELDDAAWRAVSLPGENFLFEGTVSIIEALGEVTLLYIEGLVPNEPIIAKIPGILKVGRGEKVRFTADMAKLHLFDAEGKSYRT